MEYVLLLFQKWIIIFQSGTLDILQWFLSKYLTEDTY